MPHWEAEMVEMADITICIAEHRSRLLREQHPAKAAKIFHLPIGCTPEFMVGSEARSQNGPVAGYVGALTLTGSAATAKTVRKLSSATGALTLTGAASTSKIGRKAASSTGVLALTGAAQVSSHRNIVFATGVESLTGKASAPTVNRKFVLPSLTPVVTVVS